MRSRTSAGGAAGTVWHDGGGVCWARQRRMLDGNAAGPDLDSMAGARNSHAQGPRVGDCAGAVGAGPAEGGDSPAAGRECRGRDAVPGTGLAVPGPPVQCRQLGGHHGSLGTGDAGKLGGADRRGGHVGVGGMSVLEGGSVCRSVWGAGIEPALVRRQRRGLGAALEARCSTPLPMLRFRSHARERARRRWMASWRRGGCAWKPRRRRAGDSCTGRMCCWTRPWPREAEARLQDSRRMPPRPSVVCPSA